MLDISLYSQEKKPIETMEITQDFYTWLTESDFSRIGKSEEREMEGDGEVVQTFVVLLEGD